MSDFNVIKGDDHEGRFGELYQAVSGRLAKDIGSVRHSVEAKFTEGNVNINILALPSFRDLLSESFELTIKICSSSSLLLLLLKFFFVAISELPFSISSLIKLDVRSFSIKLHILGLLLPNDNRILEMNMDDNNELVLAWLEEQMLNVTEENINSVERIQW
jgi:hypothetical protein